MKYMKLMRLGLGTLLLGAATMAGAGPTDWQLSGVTFDDGTKMTGSFVYDASTDTLDSYSLTVNNGSLSAFTYNSSDSSQYGTTIGTGGYSGTSNDELFLLDNDYSRYLQLDFASPLTNAGGTSLLLTGGPQSDNGQASFECDNCSNIRYVTAGEATTLPEPGSIALFGIAFAGLLGVRLKRGGGIERR